MYARMKRPLTAAVAAVAVAVALECAVAYWWVVCGPFPESAWPA